MHFTLADGAELGIDIGGRDREQYKYKMKGRLLALVTVFPCPPPSQPASQSPSTARKSVYSQQSERLPHLPGLRLTLQAGTLRA